MKPGGRNTLFDDPIPLPAGGSLKTLRDADEYMSRRPLRDRQRREWQDAGELLRKAATIDGAWRWFARRAVYIAIHGDATAAKPEPRASKAEQWRERRREWKRRP